MENFKQKETKIYWIFRNNFPECQAFVFKWANNPDKLPLIIWALIKQIARKMNFCIAPKRIALTEAEAYALENILQREGEHLMAFELQKILNQTKYNPINI
jgi:hypothetical protein